jgi:menaquinone-dependent protoporphyrinogen oxidase
MPASILVGYSTVAGSTREVAEAIAEELRKQGLEVDLKHVREVQSLAGYRGVVLGSPLYMFRWSMDALRFLSKQRKVLEGLPVAVFAMGPFHNKEDELKSAREQLDKALAKFPWLKPVSIGVFPGKFDPKTLKFPYSITPMRNMPFSDERDWDVIRAWAGGLVTSLH